MALEFPSWLEWLEWVVGSDWPHGNEDLMWQMARDFDDVAKQIDDLIPDLDGLIKAVGDAYPEGQGGEAILKWVTPLRDGDDKGHGSLKELGEHYRSLGSAADNMGDQLESAKLNFYIAGAWLVAELAWAAATGPFAPALEAEALATGRVTFRLLGQQLGERIMSTIARHISNPLLKRILPKLIYEVGQEAIVEVFQGTSQEFLVQTIQKEQGHIDAYDWGAMKDNAIISGIAGGAGGAIGLGANKFLPTDMGGWKGSLNGAMTGAIAGAGGAGAAWLSGGLLNGNWEFDPRSLTGGALSGAGPSGIYGHFGKSDHNGPMHGNTGDGSAPGTNAPGSSSDSNAGNTNGANTNGAGDTNGTGNQTGAADTNGTGNHTGAADTNGTGNHTGAADTNETRNHTSAADTNGGANTNGANDTNGSQSSAGDSNNTGGSPGNGHDGGLHTAGSTATPEADAPPAKAEDSSSTDNDTRAHDGPVGVDSRNNRPDANAEVDTDDSEPTSSRTHESATSSPAPDAHTPADTNAPATDKTADSPSSLADASHESRVNAHSDGGPAGHADPATTGHTTTGTPPGTPATIVGTNAAPGGTSMAPGTSGTPSTSTPGAPAHSAPTSQTGTTNPGSTTPNTPGDAKLTPAPRADRPLTPTDGSIPAPSADIPTSRASISDLTPQPGSVGPVQAGHTDTEAPVAKTDSGTGRQDTAGTPEGVFVVGTPVTDTPTPNRPSDNNSRPPADRGTASPVGEFRGDARTGDNDLDLETVLKRLGTDLALVTPEDVAWNPDQGHFVLPDGGTVTFRIGPTTNNAVADFTVRTDDSGHVTGYDINISPRARDQDVVRALAHELAEIRLSQDPVIVIDPDDVRPDRMTTQLGGRFAELDVLTAQIDRATLDPARTQELPSLRRDLDDVLNELGFRDPAHADTARQLLAEHDPRLAQRVELEEQGVNNLRPAFNANLDTADFDQAAADHLNQLRELLSGDHADAMLSAERMALNAAVREELARRVFKPIFGPDAKPARGTINTKHLLSMMDPINAAINDPALSGPDRAMAVREAIARFRDDLPERFHDALPPDVIPRMYAAADALASGPDHITAMIDPTNGGLTVDGEPMTLSDFLRSVDSANRAATEHGLNTEYTVVLHDPVDGKQAVEILARPRPQHRLPIDQYRLGDTDARVPHQPRPSVPAAVNGGHTIDVGTGRSAFGVEMTPVADRSGGGLVIKTELASEFPIKSQRRYDLGIEDPGPLTEPGTVTVFGDLLFNGHILGDGTTGDGARIYLNNVSAHLDNAGYDAIAAELAKTLAPGGRIELQWDTKPEEEGGVPGDRGHITGLDLWDALQRHYANLGPDGTPNPFRIVEYTAFPPPGNSDYIYSIDAGASKNLDTARMAKIAPPLPEQRMIIAYDPDGTHTPEHGTASPVGEFHGDARPEGTPDLTRDFVFDQIRNNLGLITPDDVAWNRDTNQFVLERDGHTLTIGIDVGPTTDNAVADFTARTDDSGNVTGYDINVSPRARDGDITRALAHELAEITLSQDPEILTDPHDDRPTRLTSHLGGRIAEIEVLTAQIDQAATDPARARELPGLRRDLSDLLDHLGRNDPAHADTLRQLLTDHDPALVRRLDLETQGLHEHRPTFDPHLTNSQFDQSSADHLQQLQQSLTGDHVDDVLRAEEMSLNARMREELARRIFDPLFDPSTKPARGTVDVKHLLGALDPVNAAINDPTLRGPEQARALREAIARFRDDMPDAFHDAIGPDVFPQMYAAADAFAASPNRITGVIDQATGQLTVAGTPTTLGDFLRSVDNANRTATAHGLNVEYTVVVHDPADGKATVDIMSRPRPQHRLPIDQNVFGPENTRIPHQPRDSVPAAVTGGHTIDVGVGRSAFGVEMTPVADRSGGGLVIKTELAYDFPVAGQRRRDLGILDPGPLTAPGTVMVFGDLLTSGHLLTDGPDGGAARIYINNVSADLPDAVYRDIAANLAATLAPGGQIEIQWDMKPEKEGGEPGDRKHILGTKLWDALRAHYREQGLPNPFHVRENAKFPYPGNNNYDYTIDAGASNKLNTARMAKFNPPLPEHRMIISYDPDVHAPEHGNASAVGEFRGDHRPEADTEDRLQPEFVVDQIKKNLGLITPDDISWNHDEGHFLLPGDQRTVTVRVGPLPGDDVAVFDARPDGSGFDITISDRARDGDVVRALAHELAEIKLLDDPQILVDPDDDRPTRMSTQLGGRFAELDVLTAQIDRATYDPERASELPSLRRDLNDLLDKLGFHDPAHADTVRELLAEHDSTLARRIELEQQNLLSHRPKFDPDLTESHFDEARDEHLNRLRDLLAGDHADALVRAERLALNGHMREELVRRIFDPVLGKEAKAARRLVDAEFMLTALDPVNAAVNDPTLPGPERAQALHQAIDAFHAQMPEAFVNALRPDAFADMHTAATDLADGPNRIMGEIDRATGQLTVDGERTTLIDFLRSVDAANRGATAHGLNLEYTVAIYDAADGTSAVEVLARPRPQHRLPIDQNVFGENNERIPHETRPPVPAAAAGGHTIDVGVGRGAFAVEMTPAADRSGGGLVIKTELASDFPVKAQRRRDLGIQDPGPLTEPGTVMVFGDLLTGGHLLTDTPGGTAARIYINNVSADLPDAVYRDIAANLAATLAPGGQVEIQWDMKPEKEGGTRGDRNHILGTKLWDALRAHYREQGLPNPFHVRENAEFPYPGNNNYFYTIDAGASNNLNTARMETYNPPLPEHRMILSYEPDGDPHHVPFNAETPEHGTASPVGEFHGDARPVGDADLTRDAVLGRVEDNLGLIRPADVTWNPETNQFELRTDNGRTLTVTVGVGPTTDNAVADFTARTNDSGEVTGYDINVSPRARDQDVVRALAHELAEISLSQDPNVLTDPNDDRPTRLTSHLGGRIAEMRVLVAQIDDIVASRDPARAQELPGLRRDLNDLLDHLGHHDRAHADTLRQLLIDHDPALARRLGLELETPRSEYDRLLQQRKELVRELEFRRAQRDDRIGRLLDVGNPEEALGTPDRLEQTVLRLFDETATRVVGIEGVGEEGPHSERLTNSPEERAHRREALRKLTAAAEEVIGLRERIQETDQQIHELERAGAAAGLPRTAAVTAEVDRLAAERADELLRIKPRRAMRDDLAERLGLLDQNGAVDEAALGPDRLDETLNRQRAEFPDRAGTIDALGDAARDVNQAHNRIGRIQDEMARAVGEWRRAAAAEGARMVTDRVAIVEGHPRQIIVFGPRNEIGRPFADYDRALADALRDNAAVAQAMVAPETVVRRVRVTVGRDDQVTVSNHRGPEVNRLLGRDGFNSTRWRDADGNWHNVNPSRPDWVGNRDAEKPPKSPEARILPEGVIGWGTDPLQAAVEDVFVDPATDPATGQPPRGVNEDLLPHMPGGSDPIGSQDTPTYDLPFSGAASKIMVLIVQSARLSGFTWFSDPTQPTRIHPGFKRPKWFRTGSTEVQPMVREWTRAEHVPDNGEIAQDWHERRSEAAEKWARVQAWADQQYARFTADNNVNGPDDDVAAISRMLSEHREVRRRELVEFIDAANDVATGRAGSDPNKLIAKVTRLLGDENAGYAAQLATDLRENLNRIDPTDRAELRRVLDERLRAAVDTMLPPAFTAEEVQQIKDHLMREPHWYRDPVDGQWVKRPLDPVADVAEAWNRLIEGNPLPPDILLLRDALAESNFLRDNPTATWRQANAHVAALDGFHWDAARPPLTGDRAGIPYEPGPPVREHGTASPIGEFRGDARPEGAQALTRNAVINRIQDNLGLVNPENVTWNDDANRFELRTVDGRTLTIAVDVGPTTDNAVADFTSRTDDSGNVTGYDINVSPGARDQDIVRAVAHELAEISLAHDPEVLTDPDDDRPSRLTSHLGGRYAEMRVLVAQIEEISASRDKQRMRELPGLQRDLADLIDHVGLRDPEHAPTAERLLNHYDSDLYRRIDQARTPVDAILRPGDVDPHAEPTPHDLGRIRQLRSLAEQLEISPGSRQSDPAHDAVRREALALVERLGLREGTPGATARRAIVDERLNEQARRQVGDLLADVGRPESALSEADQQFVDQVRLETRAAAALDFLSPLHSFHIGVHKAHQKYQKEVAAHHVTDNLVEDPDTHARWHSWPPGMELSTASAPVPDIGLPTDPRQLHEEWARLSDEEKDALYRQDPYIGNRDGLPQIDRDRYNRQTLAMLREQAEQAQNEDRLKQIDDMLSLLDSTQEGLPPHLLSYLDEKLQYIYALGNPDTADNVAVALAGALRRRSGVGYAVQTLRQLRQAALAIDPTAETSVLLFGAYNNPESLAATISSRGAEEGAQKVREFHDGLRVTNQGERVNITTIAHSYGGVTGGHAAGHGHELNTDAVVFIGSWGTGVDSVDDLRLTGVDPADIRDHVFATMAEHDSIQLMPPTHGPAPDDPTFGATVFPSASTPSPTRLGWNPGDHLAPHYFGSHNPSYKSLGRIIAGYRHLIR